MSEPEWVETVVVGGGQAGLSVGYHLAQRGLPFVILDANERTGDSWRKRWDSLRLFTPGRFNGLAGMPFPGPAQSFPTKDEVADYLEAYQARFELPVRAGIRVEGLSRRGDKLVVAANGGRIQAENVVVAMATHQVPWVPPFAPELDSAVGQLHSAEYRNPSQLKEGGVLVVGAGNSQGARSPSRSPANTPPGWQGRNPVMSRSTSRARWVGMSCYPFCFGSSATAC